MCVSACVRDACLTVCASVRENGRKKAISVQRKKVEDMEIVCHFFTLLFVIFICSMSSGVLVLFTVVDSP